MTDPASRTILLLDIERYSDRDDVEQAYLRRMLFGKWHQTPPREISAVGPFDRWPTGEGFDTFYGFMGAEMNHWYPQLYAGTTPVEPDRMPEDGYHLTEDLVDHVVDYLRLQQSLTPDKPFFTYLALGATHAPFHVAPEWIEKYRGQFDGGWHDLREAILTRQKELGLVPPETELGPWPDEVPHWEDVDPQARRVGVRLMETYAGFAEHTDRQVGRIVDTLQELGILDDTLFVYLLGDNGASGEGGVEGTVREHLVGHGFADDLDDMDRRLERIGDPTTYAMYPVGWALAMNTPYQWTKQIASHFGGVRDGLVLHWPAGIAARGEVRHQFHHVIDILPTVLDVAGLPLPETVNGVPQQPVEGTSMRYSFDDPDAAERRGTQYFEMIGNRAIFHEGWSAGARHGVPWLMTEEPRGFDDDVWELYDTRSDWAQAHDLAAVEPGRLARLRALFDEEAARYQVFPLDDRVTERENPELAGRLDLHGGRSTMSFAPGTGRLTEEAAPNVKNRSYAVTVQVEVPTGDVPSVTGVLVAQGGRFGGWSLYVHDGVLSYAYNLYGRDLTTIRGDRAIGPGRHDLVLEVEYAGGPPGSATDVRLVVDDEQVGVGHVPATTAYYFAFDETFNVGVDRGTPVTDDYAPVRNAFTGRILNVRFDLGRAEPLTWEAEQLLTTARND